MEEKGENTQENILAKKKTLKNKITRKGKESKQKISELKN